MQGIGQQGKAATYQSADNLCQGNCNIQQNGKQ